MKQKKNLPVPLVALNNLTKWYPGIWDKVDPKNINTAKEYCDNSDYDKLSQSMYLVSAMSRWRVSKHIFEVDQELCEIFMNTDKLDADIPNEIVTRLVYDTFYVKLPDKYITVRNVNNENLNISIDGFFYNVIGNSIIIVIMYTSGHTQSLGFDLQPGKTLRECIENNLKANEDVYKTINFMLQIVLYLCADNADIEENPVQKTIYKKSDKIKDNYSELRRWDVGFRYGQAIRKSKAKQKAADTVQDNREGSHSRKRTHVRRGHYHHYWTGSEKAGNRKLVLKWTSPVVINAEYENTVTIHKVSV